MAKGAFQSCGAVSAPRPRPGFGKISKIPTGRARARATPATDHGTIGIVQAAFNPPLTQPELNTSFLK
jgi:hypothetical protein